MIGDIPFSKAYLISFLILIFRICFLIYSWRINGNCALELLPRCGITRYLLCSCPLPLCAEYRCSFCFNRGLHYLIPFNSWVNYESKMVENSIFDNIRRSKLNFLPYTFFRSCWHTSTLFRLPQQWPLLRDLRYPAGKSWQNSLSTAAVAGLADSPRVRIHKRHPPAAAAALDHANFQGTAGSCLQRLALPPNTQRTEDLQGGQTPACRYAPAPHGPRLRSFRLPTYPPSKSSPKKNLHHPQLVPGVEAWRRQQTDS